MSNLLNGNKHWLSASIVMQLLFIVLKKAKIFCRMIAEKANKAAFMLLIPNEFEHLQKSHFQNLNLKE